MKRLWTQVRMEHVLFLRDPGVVAFHVCLPLLLLVLLSRAYDQVWAVRWSVAIADEDRSVTSRRLVEALRGLPEVSVVDQTASALRASASSRPGGASILLRPGLGASGAMTSVDVEGDPAVTHVVRPIVAGLLSEAVAEPPVTHDLLDPGRSPPRRSGFAARLLPAVIGMVVASVALFGFGARLASYRQRGFLRRLAVTPGGVSQFLLAQAIHRVLFIVLQSALLVAVGTWVLDLADDPRVVPFLAVVTSGAIAFLGLGFLIGGVAPSSELATGWCHLLFAPLVLLSGAFHPGDAPAALRAVASLLPMTYLVDGLQRSLILGGGVLADVLVLLGWAAALLVLSVHSFAPDTDGR